jgi:D-galactose 1-dehydrogenase
MSAALRLGLVGFGKIARDQHLPAIAGTPGLELVAVASRHAQAEGFANYPDIDTMLAAQPEIDAVILCVPPHPRFAAARSALLARKHVFLEKPPGATLSEVEALVDLADSQGTTLFASWHSREAAAVAQAKTWLAGAAISSAAIAWKEDVRVWHPGQAWIWEPGGFGVFDPGINALSILTEILPEPVRVLSAELHVPSNRAAPIAASLKMETRQGIPIAAELDFRQTGPQSWDISVQTDKGTLMLSHGGNSLAIDSAPQAIADEQEYPALYRRFADLVRRGVSDVDLAPLRLVADAFLCGRVYPTEAFHD